MNRREFFRTAAGSGLAAAITSGLSFGKDANSPTGTEPNKPSKENFPQVPRRQLGKAKIDVASLSLGVMFDARENEIVLHKALQWGVNYWDTAYGYAGGKAEEGIGAFFAKYPDKRKEIFLVTKASGAHDSATRTEKLQASLKRMNTNYIDLYFGVHGLSKGEELTPELKQWAADAKAKGLIKYFGFSTHGNMTECLEAAAKNADWIDGIMTSYNYRLMQDPKFMAAVDKCKAAGIAIVAMKVQAGKSDKANEKPLDRYFLDKGYTEGQAKIKTILQDDRLCSACLSMNNIAYLTANVAAVLDKTKLSQADMEFMNGYAKETATGYCSGCGLCNSAVPQMPYINDVMRSLMYNHKYENPALAKETFANVQARVNCKISEVDYSKAESICPNRNEIGKLMLEAEKLLA